MEYFLAPGTSLDFAQGYFQSATPQLTVTAHSPVCCAHTTVSPTLGPAGDAGGTQNTESVGEQGSSSGIRGAALC